MVGFENVSNWICVLVLGSENLTTKISSTVQTHYTYNFLNSKLHRNSVLEKSSDFFFDVQSVFKSLYIC